MKSFFVLLVALKRKDFEEKTIITISKLIPQNMLLVLECAGEAKLAAYHTKLMQTDWKRKEDISIELKGLNMDTVWKNIIVQIGGITIEQGNTLDEQIAVNEQRMKIQKEIDRLTKAAKIEKQPKKKFELAQKINKPQKGIGGMLMEVKFNIPDWLKIPLNILLPAIWLFSGMLLLIPDSWLETLYLLEWRNENGFAIGLTFAVASCLLLVYFLFYTKKLISAVLYKFTYKRKTMRRIADMNDTERAIIFKLYNSMGYTCDLDYNQPLTQGLLARNYIYIWVVNSKLL